MKIWRVTDWDEITEFFATKQDAMARARGLVKTYKEMAGWYSVGVIEHHIDKKMSKEFLCYALTASSNGQNFTDGWDTVYHWETKKLKRPE